MLGLGTADEARLCRHCRVGRIALADGRRSGGDQHEPRVGQPLVGDPCLEQLEQLAHAGAGRVRDVTVTASAADEHDVGRRGAGLDRPFQRRQIRMAVGVEPAGVDVAQEG